MSTIEEMENQNRKSSTSSLSSEKFTLWIGSPSSLLLHTLVFVGTFVLGLFHIADWTILLLVLTTAVSLEAIYLAIFIQMTVNRNTESLEEVEDDIDEIQEDIDEIQEDIDDIEEEEDKDEVRKQKQSVTLDQITTNLQKLAADIETLKKVQR